LQAELWVGWHVYQAERESVKDCAVQEITIVVKIVWAWPRWTRPVDGILRDLRAASRQ
jgi:hypothetical protein